MNLTKIRKKKGFTLIELMAVIAIIAILAAVLVPTVSGYINRSKKTAVITQVRNVVSAVETYNATATTSIDVTPAKFENDFTDNTVLVSTLVDTVGDDLISLENINKLGNLTVGEAVAINKDPDALKNIEVYPNGYLKSYSNKEINSTDGTDGTN